MMSEKGGLACISHFRSLEKLSTCFSTHNYYFSIAKSERKSSKAIIKLNDRIQYGTILEPL